MGTRGGSGAVIGYQGSFSGGEVLGVGRRRP